MHPTARTVQTSAGSRRWLPAVGVLIVLGFAGPGCAQPQPDLTVMLPMADGIRLATDVYLPETGGPKWPVRLLRTPYGRVRFKPDRGADADHGYAMVFQDMRGRFDSQGNALAFIDCGWSRNPDGVDTINWILRQPWCNGKLGTEGGSAMGITQCMLAAADPPNLAAQYIAVAAPCLYHHAAYPGGGLRASLLVTWLTDCRFHPDNLWLIASHPFYDGHWKGVDSIARADRINVPAVHLGGWYDVFSQGTIDAFTSRHNHGGPGARGRQKLIIGPWDHGGPQRDPKSPVPKPRPVGEITFPPDSLKTPCPCRPREWFDYYLKGIDTGIDKVPAVQYYTMGAVGEEAAGGNRWHTADNWPIPSNPTPFYFQPDGTLSRTRPDKEQGLRGYRYNPLEPVPTRGGCLLCLPAGPYDQRDLEQRPDVLTFTTQPLAEPLEVTGRITARLVIISDRVDTDFTVKLTDVYPGGRSMLVADGLARCRCRRGCDRLALLKPGQPTPLEVDLWSTSIVFNRGHRIRAAVSSSNYPRFDVNVNTGWPAWPMGPVLIAHNRIACNSTHASHVLLPVVTRRAHE